MSGVPIEIKKLFRRSSINGRVFAHMKRSLGDVFEERVINLARIVHEPRMLITQKADEKEIQEAARKAQQYVNDLLIGAFGYSDRLVLDWESIRKLFRRSSTNGRVFAHMKQSLGDVFEERIVNLARIVHEPGMLIAQGADEQDIQEAARKAQQYVNDLLIGALGHGDLSSLDGESPQMFAFSKDEDELNEEMQEDADSNPIETIEMTEDLFDDD